MPQSELSTGDAAPGPTPSPASAVARPRYVCVYGTLRRGGRNDINRFSPSPRFVGMATLRGVLYSLGWYPGLVLGGADATAVVAEVYEIDAALEKALDELEEVTDQPESEYTKREVTVAVAGRALDCLVYEANPGRVAGCPVIGQGDWLVFHMARI